MELRRTTRLLPYFGFALLGAGAWSACTAGPIDVVTSRLDGLVAHWALDDTTGTRALDGSGNRHDGAVTGATWIAGRFAGGLHFEQGDEVEVQQFPQATVDWTVGLWVRPPSGDFGDAYITLVSTEEVFEGGWEMNVKLGQSDKRYQFGYYLGPGESDYYIYDCSCVAPETWTHIAAVVEGAHPRLSFYRDGVLQGRAAVPTSATPGPIRPGLSTLRMGRWQLSGRQFKGDLDDIVIYGRALPASEISMLARAPAPSLGL